MTTSTDQITTLRLTAVKHAADWRSRYDGEAADIVDQTPRTITLQLDADALADLVSDSLYYAEQMGPDNTEDIDYRPAARACLRALERAGVTWDLHPRSTVVAVNVTVQA